MVAWRRRSDGYAIWLLSFADSVGRDHTIYSVRDGFVKFERQTCYKKHKPFEKKVIHVAEQSPIAAQEHDIR